MPQPAPLHRTAGDRAVCSGNDDGRWLVWLGGAAGEELAWARKGVEAIAGVRATDILLPSLPATPTWWERAPEAEPTVAVLASSTPGVWHTSECVAIARRWPLCVMLAVGGTLADGSRRSGPVLPGIEEIPWHELPARLSIWLSDLSAGLPGTLGLPPTARREERVLAAAAGLARRRDRRRLNLSVAAPDRLALEGLAGLAGSLGCLIRGESTGRPVISSAHDLVIWQVESIDWEVLTWLELTASAPWRRPVVVVTPFPRGDGVLAALRAGAGAVVGHPVELETLAGTLLELAHRPDSGLGRGPESG